MRPGRGASGLLLLALAALAGPTAAGAPPWKDWQPAASARFPRFLDAILRQDLPEVRRNLDSGMTVDWRTEGGLTPLDLAIATANDSIALLLLARSERKPSDAWNIATAQAIHNGTIAVLQAIDRRGALPGRWDWGSTANRESPLGYALSIGASDEVFEFLLARAPDPASFSPHRLFEALPSFENRTTPAQRARRAHRLLDRGFKVQWGHGTGGEDALLHLVDASGDSSLLRRAGIHPEPRERQRTLNARLAYGARSLGAIDTLLARGADPLGAANDANTCEQESCWNSPLSLRRSSFYRGEARAPSFEWQAIARFVDHAPERVGRQLREPDHLFLAIARRDLAATMRWVERHGADSARGLGGLPFSQTHAALALAAELGDVPITRFLAALPFGARDREHALTRAVLAHSFEVVQLLMQSGVDRDLPALGGGGQVRLVGSLFDAYVGLRPPHPSDTAIARLLLVPAPGDTFRPTLPLGSWAARHRRANPVLFEYLWRRQPGPLDGKEFSARIGEDPDLLLDTAVIDHVALRGFERRVAEAVCEDFRARSDQAEGRIGLPEMATTIARLEALLARSPQLDTALGSHWTCAGRYLEIAFDARERRFHPLWRISSPFSTDGDFGDRAGDYWRPMNTKW